LLSKPNMYRPQFIGSAKPKGNLRKSSSPTTIEHLYKDA
jgi:hypothetical protein